MRYTELMENVLGPDPEVIRILKGIIAEVVPGLIGAWLFGSRATNTANDESDYDVLVATTDESPEGVHDALWINTSSDWELDEALDGAGLDLWVVRAEPGDDWPAVAEPVTRDRKPAIRLL